MNPELMALLVTAFAMPALMWVLQKIIWLPSTAEADALSDEELTTQVNSWQGSMALVKLGLSLPFMVAWFIAFRYALLATQARIPDAEFILVRNSAVGLLPAIFMGFITSSIVVAIYCVVVQPRGYTFYVAQRKRAGASRTEGAVAVFLIPFIAFSFLIFAGFLGNSARFTEDELIYDPVLGMSERHYAYSDIERMVFGHKTQRWVFFTHRYLGFVIHFKDGRTWSNGDSPNTNRELIQEVLAFLSDRTEVPVEYVPVLKKEHR